MVGMSLFWLVLCTYTQLILRSVPAAGSGKVHTLPTQANAVDLVEGIPLGWKAKEYKRYVLSLASLKSLSIWVSFLKAKKASEKNSSDLQSAAMKKRDLPRHEPHDFANLGAFRFAASSQPTSLAHAHTTMIRTP